MPSSFMASTPEPGARPDERNGARLKHLFEQAHVRSGDGRAVTTSSCWCCRHLFTLSLRRQACPFWPRSGGGRSPTSTVAARLLGAQEPQKPPKLAIVDAQYKCALTKRSMLVPSGG